MYGHTYREVINSLAQKVNHLNTWNRPILLKGSEKSHLHYLYFLLSNYYVHRSIIAFHIIQGGVLLIPDDYIPIWIFFINYLPTIVITLVNNVIPEIFDLFAQWEDRQPRPELKLKLVRLVILRISALCKYWAIYLIFIGILADCW